ncbi:hypothetical protein [Methylobacterium oryzisoli]|uniref:hypothetical protein n=1 Tax=Methylobacterium oryzisoli TaxID=3385502 RepID=UPI0038922446
MPPAYPEFFKQHYVLVKRLEEMLTTDPNQVVRSARQSIRQFEFFKPADEDEEDLKVIAIETYEELIARAEAVLAGRGGI